MALLTPADWATITGRTLTGADLTSLTAIVSAVNAAAVRLMGGNVLEGPVTYTEYYDCPRNSSTLTLRQGPVRSITTVHRNLYAGGDPSLFTSDFLLTQYSDFLLDVDRSDGFAWGRRVKYLLGANWGVRWDRPTGTLTPRPIDPQLAIKVVYSAGVQPVPDDLQMALAWAATLLLNQRRDGMPTTSESWNGESVSFASQHTANSALLAPSVFDILRQYGARTMSIA